MSKQGARLAATFSKGYSSRCAAHSKDICYVLYEHDILDVCVIHAQGAMLNLSDTKGKWYKIVMQICLSGKSPPCDHHLLLQYKAM